MLSILHYVWGGLVLLFSCMFIFHVVIGVMIANGHMPFPMPPPATQAAAPPQFPPQAGYLFVAMGGCGIVCGWVLGILTIVSGRRMMRRRSRLFSMIVAGVNCVSFPLGTTLGIFTIVVLARDSVKAMYSSAAAAPVTPVD